jgi:hypothetical protein
MDFHLLGKISTQQATELLRSFLDEESRLSETTYEIVRSEGIPCDYTVDTLPQFLKWVLSHLTTTPKAPDPTVSEWIRSTVDYQKGLFDFVDESKNLVVRASYYLGECFVRSHPKLRWTTGNPEFAYKNMPVVTGFLHEKELPPLMILDNVFRRIMKDPTRLADIDIMVTSWCKSVPN